MPVTAVAGAHDPVCPPAVLEIVARGVQDGRLVVLDDVAHLAPAEAPQVVADLIADRPRRADEARRAGFAVRRAVLGDAHVDRATAERERPDRAVPGLHHPLRLGHGVDPARRCRGANGR